ncbi:murein hydrolase activator EnvC family protein [Persicobacter psychrovividus]|uniref:Peptidase M23 n=1 Tax=Persicobacter psychrovividus TaxID=387638 RepID=A0ABN6L4G6_9BACT|nr:peptidase M23 [Persicobacter psychrovividus]
MSLNKLFFSILFSLFVFTCLPQVTFAQRNKQQLEREREQNKKKIAETARILSQNAKTTKATVGELNALNEQIKTRQEMMSSITQEVDVLNGRVEELGEVIESMSNDLEGLKKEYAKMAHTAYKSQLSQNNLLFLFSAKTFHDFVMRVQYMRQYSKARKNQIEMILSVRQTLEDQQQAINEAKQEKDQLLVAKMGEFQELEALRKKQGSVLAELKKSSRKLKKELKKRKQADAHLATLIADVIREEMAKAKASSKTSKAKKSAKVSKANVAFIGADFSKFRKKLDWPVNSGFVSQSFGKHPHPALKGVMIENPGVDIQTKSKEIVRAVHKGVVKTVAHVPGEMNTVIIVQHGEYFTVYAKLKQSTVKVGQVVEDKDPIGIVSTDADGKSELQFQVWKQREKLNPQSWLRSR